MDTLKAVWLVEKKSFSLGNLLVFRKELELLAKRHQTNRVAIHFVSQKNEFLLPSYVEEVFKSKVRFELFKEGAKDSIYIWPEHKDRYLEEGNFTLQRVASLSSGDRDGVFLEWPEEIISRAKSFLDSVGFGKRKVYICHLKNLKVDRKESNADSQNWLRFFSQFTENSNVVFVLLGSDPLPFEISGISHLFSAEQRKLPLSVQLALCGLADGFIGMASGVSTAAIFSKSPYVIFKHPLHHPEEMDREIGPHDCFSFAMPRQEIWRRLDDFENLNRGLSLFA